MYPSAEPKVIRFKASETLLGIETDGTLPQNGWDSGFKASETLLGIETQEPPIVANFEDMLQSL